MTRRTLGLIGLIILVTFPFAVETPVLAQIGEAKSGITWGELSAAVGIAVTSAGISCAVILWIVTRSSREKMNVHSRIDEVVKDMNTKFVSAIEQISSSNRVMEQKVHAIELVLAQRYVTKEDLHTEAGKILQAVERMSSDLRADVRTVYDRLNKIEPAAS